MRAGAQEIRTRAHQEPPRIVSSRQVRTLVRDHRADFVGRTFVEYALGDEQRRTEHTGDRDDGIHLVDGKRRDWRVEIRKGPSDDAPSRDDAARGLPREISARGAGDDQSAASEGYR